MARDRTAPEPRSPLQHLAAAEDGGHLADGCPWREVGLWDRDADGEPVLAMPDGLGGDVLARPHGAVRAAVPRRRCGAQHEDCFVFLEGSPMELDTRVATTPTRSSATRATGTTS